MNNDLLHYGSDSALVHCSHTGAVGQDLFVDVWMDCFSCYFLLRTLCTVTFGVLDVSQTLPCLGITCECSPKVHIPLPEVEECFLKLCFPLSINRIYILEQF